MVSHNMDDIAVIADRIIALKDGKSWRTARPNKCSPQGNSSLI